MTDPRLISVEANYYQQFDADHSRDVPGEGYGGWQTTTMQLPLAHTALVIMHAWDCGTPQEFPGWHRAVEYFPRAERIASEVFPPLLAAARHARMPLFHVVGPGTYFQDLPGYKFTCQLAGPTPAPPPAIQPDPGTLALKKFREAHVMPGCHNQSDIDIGFRQLDFPKPARPLDSEPIAEDAHQLLALCRHHQISHLIYAGFAINWCLLMSPGGMLDMRRHGLMCSTIRQATTAVENKESARHELAKELALWRTALGFGFVFNLDPLAAALATSPG
jgi:nicotinamidase-related amidase